MDQMTKSRIEDMVCEHLGVTACNLDAPQTVCFRAGSAAVFVRLLADEPVHLRVYSPLLREVPETDELILELNRINGDHHAVRIFQRNETVFAAVELLATTLDPEELVNACNSVGDVADHYDTLLHARFGGTLAFEDD